MLTVNKESLAQKIETFSAIGQTKGGGVTRLALSPADVKAREEILAFCRKHSLMVKIDDLGNIYATLGAEKAGQQILAGSHSDSVICGGNYDGILGVIAMLETIETLIQTKTVLNHPLTLVVWTNEEGVRFPPAMMSSGILAGAFTEEDMFNVTDNGGITFKNALAQSTFSGDKTQRLNPKDTKAYLELHIEQGPALEDAGKDIGVVLGVCGMVHYDFTFTGQSDHAGTTPMKNRHDALVAAASFICELQAELGKIDPTLVYTFGEISAHPNLHTVIPGTVTLSLDARHEAPEVISAVRKVVDHYPDTYQKCQLTRSLGWSRQTTPFASELIDAVQNVTEKLAYPYQKMYSGAGHDAQYIAKIVPSTMIFVPSKDGRSHCEAEFTSLEACAKGVNVLLNTILEIDQT